MNDRKQILLAIDDDGAQLDFLRALLAAHPLDVLTTTDPVHGLELVRTAHPDIVLTDFSMPRLNGIQVLESIREFDPEIDVLVMTGAYCPERAAEAMQKGACNYLSKPVLHKLLGPILIGLRSKSSLFRVDGSPRPFEKLILQT